jgi:alpha-glucosidase (family GH31 glycosyl hydrolase)
MYALEDITVKAVEDLGMDFWWLDWQQGETQANTGQDGRPDGKMNPTIWTAKARVTDSLRRCRLGLGCSSKRGVVFARWGGLGQHRQHLLEGLEQPPRLIDVEVDVMIPVLRKRA